MKVKCDGFIVAKKDPWDSELQYYWSNFVCTSVGEIEVCEHSIEFDVPDDFNPVPQQIKALNAEKTKLMAEFNKRVTEINNEIANLQCIEFNPTEAA